MVNSLYLVRSVLAFFYGYVYEGYYDNNMDRCFGYLSGYGDNDTVWSNLLRFHSEGKFRPLPEWSTQDSTVWLLRRRLWGISRG